MKNTAPNYLTSLLLELAAAVDRIPQGRCDCIHCWAVDRMSDGLWYCRSCGRYVAATIE